MAQGHQKRRKKSSLEGTRFRHIIVPMLFKLHQFVLIQQ
jgi:hypothetical protein